MKKFFTQLKNKITSLYNLLAGAFSSKKEVEAKPKHMNKIQRFLYGVKLGIKLSLLPPSVEKFHNSPLVRIFRVIGGISILLILTRSEQINKYLLLYIIFPIAILQFIYILSISVIKFCYYLYLLKNKKLQVRNSPLDKIASIGLNLVACVKGTCQYGLSAGVALSLGVSIDEVLLAQGREPVFRNAFGKPLDDVLNSLGYENPNKDITNCKSDIKTLKHRYKEYSNLRKDLAEVECLSEQEGIQDSELVKEVRQDFKARMQQEKNYIARSQSKILSSLRDINSRSND